MGDEMDWQYESRWHGLVMSAGKGGKGLRDRPLDSQSPNVLYFLGYGTWGKCLTSELLSLGPGTCECLRSHSFYSEPPCLLLFLLFESRARDGLELIPGRFGNSHSRVKTVQVAVPQLLFLVKEQAKAHA